MTTAREHERTIEPFFVVGNYHPRLPPELDLIVHGTVSRQRELLFVNIGKRHRLNIYAKSNKLSSDRDS
jgi:hypothetical protein